MFDDPSLYGPHFEPGLIGPNGRLARLHKGAKTPAQQKAPPPVRETARDIQFAKDDERRRASTGSYSRTLFGGTPLAEPTTGRKTLLGAQV